MSPEPQLSGKTIEEDSQDKKEEEGTIEELISSILEELIDRVLSKIQIHSIFSSFFFLNSKNFKICYYNYFILNY